MEYFYFRYDPLTLIVVALSFILLLIFVKEIFYYLRRLIPKNVKCWFCHSRSSVAYESSNSWVCKNCEQYNGFTSDGRYNKIIPSQYDKRLNSSTFTYHVSRNEWQTRSQLCEKCNLKQQFKVKQLGSFVPINDRNFDKEVEHFEKQIEKGLELCSQCDKLVLRVLEDIREELSLPKKLYSAVSKINVRGEKALYINIFLSIILGCSVLMSDAKVALKWGEELTGSLSTNHHFKEYFLTISNHSVISALLQCTTEIFFTSAVFINVIAFYQTRKFIIFLNAFSWAILFFLSLFPGGYNELIHILKVSSSLISMSISTLILLHGSYVRSKKKLSTMENSMGINTQNSPLTPDSTFHSNRSESLLNLSSGEDVTTSIGSPYEISSSMSSLSLGVRRRRGLLNPARFNPFTSQSPSPPPKAGYQSTSPMMGYQPSSSKRGYQTSLYEGYESPITTIPSYPCFNSSCTPTLAYYISTQQFPKISPFLTSTPHASTKKESTTVWTFIHSVPLVLLVISNLFLIFTIFFRMT